MIQDLDGATTEPSRRWHVAVLSGATAVVSLVLFYVLVAPPTFVGAPLQVGAPPQAAPPSPTRSFAMTVVSNPFINLPLDLPRSGMCADATKWGPLFHLAADATNGQAFTVVYDRTGSLPVAVVREERGSGRLAVTCVTPDSFVPRINRAR